MRSVPGEVYLVTGSTQICNHGRKILLDEVWEHKQIVKARSPSSRRFRIRVAPEPSHQRTYEQLLGKAHPRVRRHFESAQFDKPQPTRSAVWRVQLIDAKLGTMRVTRNVNKKIAEDSINQPWRACSVRRAIQLLKRYFQLVHRIAPSLINAWRLTRRADEHTGEEIGHCRVVQPIAD